MSQVHRKLAEEWLAVAERGFRPPLTAWEVAQLLRGWLAWDASRADQPSAAQCRHGTAHWIAPDRWHCEHCHAEAASLEALRGKDQPPDVLTVWECSNCESLYRFDVDRCDCGWARVRGRELLRRAPAKQAIDQTPMRAADPTSPSTTPATGRR